MRFSEILRNFNRSAIPLWSCMNLIVYNILYIIMISKGLFTLNEKGYWTDKMELWIDDYYQGFENKKVYFIFWGETQRIGVK